MNYVFKSLLTLMFTLALSPSFSQIHTIELRLDPTTDTLIDPGTTGVDHPGTVVWVIKPGEKIRSFNIIGKGHPFKTKLPDPNTDHQKISREVKNVRKNWKYTIRYTTEENISARFLDPKISVMPSGISFWELILILGSAVTFVASFVFIRNWRLNKKNAGT